MISSVRRKKYHKPEVTLVILDYTISLVMKSKPDKPPKGPVAPATPGGSPFASPFGERAFD